MQAVHVVNTGPAESLTLVDLPHPQPGPSQVVIETAAISLNQADIYMRQGLFPVMPPLPYIPGFECSGTIAAVGAAVTHVHVGQRVAYLGSGCYAERVLAEAPAVIPLPDAIDLDEAAALPLVYLTAYHLLHTLGNLKAGQTVLMYAAASGVGVAIAQLARLSNIRVIGISSTPEKLEFAQQQGFTHVLSRLTDDIATKVRELTNGRGVDLIADPIGGPSLIQRFALLAPLGQIIWYHMFEGVPPEQVVSQMATYFMNNIGLRTMAVTGMPLAVRYQPMPHLLEYLVAGQIKPHISERLPLREVVRAHQLLESHHVVGKILLKP